MIYHDLPIERGDFPLHKVLVSPAGSRAAPLLGPRAIGDQLSRHSHSGDGESRGKIAMNVTLWKFHKNPEHPP